METFQTHIFAANGAFYDGPCESLIVPTLDGQYGIWAHHSNMISAVVPGALTYRIPGEAEQIAVVSGGLVKVENNEVLVLVDSVERPEEIDENRAQHAADEAREALLQKKSIEEYRFAQSRLARELERLKIKRNHGKR